MKIYTSYFTVILGIPIEVEMTRTLATYIETWSKIIFLNPIK